jgi:hypothetical protein
MVKNDHYVIPNERVALLEYKRILSDGLANIVGSLNKSIISNPKLLLSKFTFEDKNLAKNHPIFIALYNSIQRS